jgi:hypothetical protein
VTGGGKARTVRLVELPDGTRVGVLSLQVRNDSHFTGRVRARFFGDEAASTPLTRKPRDAGKGLQVSLAAPRQAAMFIRRRDVALLAVRFHLSPQTPMRVMLGRVLVSMRRVAPRGSTHRMRIAVRKVKPKRVFVRISGARVGPPDVSFVPPAITLRVAKGNPVKAVADYDADVALRGDGARALVTALDGSTVGTILQGDSGGQAQVHLDNWRMKDGEARATLHVGKVSKAATYSGDLPLVAAAKDSPKLAVTVKSQVWFPWALVVVALGAVLGGLASRAWGLRREKLVLRGALIAALRRYESTDDAWRQKPASYKIELLVLGSPPWYRARRCEDFPSEFGARDLLCRIASARDETNMAWCRAKVKEDIAIIDRWRRIEPEAQALARERDDLPAPRGGHSFTETAAWKQATNLLSQARAKPTEIGDVDQLIDQLHGQTDVVALAKAAWDLTTEAAEVATELAAQTDGESAQANQLQALASARLDALRANPRKDVPSPAEIERAQSQLDAVVSRLSAGMADVYAELDNGGTSAQGTAPRESLRRVATSASNAYARAGRATIGRVSAVGRWLWGVVKPSSVLAAIARVDWVFFLLSLFVAAAVYSLGLYGDTWGSYSDVLTAFSAGFLGKIGFDFAAQWPYRSRGVPEQAPEKPAQEPA